MGISTPPLSFTAGFFLLLNTKTYKYGLCETPCGSWQSQRLEYVRPYSHSDLYCGVNVPAETGKMSRSDKRGATLPKVATVALLLRNDVFFLPSLAGKVATSVAKLSDEFPEGWNITDYKTVAAIFEKITPPPLCFYAKKSTIYCGDIFRSSCGVLPKVFLKVL